MSDIAPYSWYMRGRMQNASTLHNAEIIRTRFEWYQPAPDTNVDVFWADNTSSNYWSSNNANPRCYSQPACEFVRGDVGWNAGNAVLPAGTTRYWAVDLDGTGQTDWFGDYQVCLDVEFNDAANTTCTNICSSYSGGGTPTNTPTPTDTPVLTPSNTPSFTPSNTPSFTPPNTPTITPTPTITFTPSPTATPID